MTRKTMTSSNEYCCVFNCSSVRKKDQSISFHAFPKAGQEVQLIGQYGVPQIWERRKLWEEKVGMVQNVTKSMRVCSLHFSDDDYEIAGWCTRKRLKSTAVPSKKLPCYQLSEMKELIKHRHYRGKRIKPTIKKILIEQLGFKSTSLYNFSHPDIIMFEKNRENNELIGTQTVGVQVNCHDLMCYENVQIQVDIPQLVDT